MGAGLELSVLLLTELAQRTFGRAWPMAMVCFAMLWLCRWTGYLGTHTEDIVEEEEVVDFGLLGAVETLADTLFGHAAWLRG